MIYLLEDDPTIRNFVEYALNNSGFEAKGFACNVLEKESLEKQAKLTHVNILDDSAAGFTIEKENVMATLYHPDAAANPNDTAALMNQFVEMMKGGNQNA